MHNKNWTDEELGKAIDYLKQGYVYASASMRAAGKSGQSLVVALCARKLSLKYLKPLFQTNLKGIEIIQQHAVPYKKKKKENHDE